MATAIVAAITDVGRSKFADMLANGRSFTITSFVTGQGGHDTSDPQVALTPDPTVLTLPQQTFGPKAVTNKTLLTTTCVQYTCDLSNLEAVGELSNIGLIGTVIFSPILGDPLVGTTFLFALGNMPLSVKTDAETKEFQISVQF